MCIRDRYYEKALELDPENKAALEYQGELYVVTNRPQLANENLIKLESLCPKSCDELEKLQDFISSKIEKEKVNTRQQSPLYICKIKLRLYLRSKSYK